MATTGVGSSSGTNSSNIVAKGSRDAFSELKTEDFLNLMITELQNQDPLNPADNTQLLEQLSQMQSIESTTKLTTTLESVLLGQSLSTASGLIDKRIEGLDDDGNAISGIVSRVVVSDRTPKLIVDEKEVSLTNVRQVNPSE